MYPSFMSTGWFVERSSSGMTNTVTLHKSVVIRLMLDAEKRGLIAVCDDLPGFLATGANRADLAAKLERELRGYFEIMGNALLSAKIVFEREASDGFRGIIPAFVADIALADTQAVKRSPGARATFDRGEAPRGPRPRRETTPPAPPLQVAPSI